VYDGYQIIHDPSITAYAHLTTNAAQPQEPPQIGTDVFAIIAITIFAIGAAAFILKRR
jgi:hypothetical protein